MSARSSVKQTAQSSARERLKTLEAALQRQTELLDDQRQTLVDLHSAMVELGAVIDTDGSDPPVASVSVIGPDHVIPQTESLMRQSRHIRSSVRRVDIGPGVAEDVVSELRERIAAGCVQRNLYAQDVYDSPAGQRWMRMWAEAGEQQRITPERLVEYAVFDDRAAVVALDWDDPMQGYLLVRDPLLIRVYTTMFDLAYAAGFPPLHAEQASSDGDDRLLELLGLGLKDEAIARYLGISLRTVRRRVAALMDQYLVSNRFQLGAATAARAGSPSEATSAASPKGGRATRTTPRWR